uniref:Uncharacterized protein n=1 Tax=Tanacetum cinerariifolium TaxID=118510 RepID=A0A699ICD4_TANCI|nr:hypothetical protein [Tanacetum cinerariifolium]
MLFYTTKQPSLHLFEYKKKVVVQADSVNIQRRNVGNGGRFERSATTAMLKASMHENAQNQEFKNPKELEELSANICMMARIQKADSDSEDGPSYDSAFIKYEVNRLHALLDAKTASKRTAFTNCEDTVLSIFYDKVKQILDYLHAIFNAMQKEFPKYVQVMMNIFESMESELDETLKQNGILNDRLLEATLNHHIEKCVLMCSDSKNDNLNDEIRKVKRESKDIQENLLKQIMIIQNDFQRCQA